MEASWRKTREFLRLTQEPRLVHRIFIQLVTGKHLPKASRTFLPYCSEMEHSKVRTLRSNDTPGWPLHQSATVPPGQQGNASPATGSGITLCIAPTHWVDEQRGGRMLAVDIGTGSNAGSNPLCGCGHNQGTSMVPLGASGEQGKAELLLGKASHGAAFPKHSTGRISSQAC